MNAKYMSAIAKKVCKARHFSPTDFEFVNADKPSMASGKDDPEYVVIRAWNSKREINITNHDMAYAHEYM